MNQQQILSMITSIEQQLQSLRAMVLGQQQYGYNYPQSLLNQNQINQQQIANAQVPDYSNYQHDVFAR